ncbi:SMP-30/gluconolactonase/LRE family protein [Halocatena halophila]|uniref:SMP-30/gluconolactonase/LRE family protein n=1 Tax=Halocatena halophila TaxID=2814576 RepID=UPI002ED3E5DA
MPTQLHRFIDQAYETGEGPLYHPDEDSLYWVDIPNGHLYRYDFATDTREQCYSGPSVGGVTIQSDGALLLFKEHGTITRWDDGEESVIIPEIPEVRGSRFNDVIAGPHGRVYCGTMPPDGRLYRLDRDGSIVELLSEVQISNGLGFSPDTERVYFAETEAETIWQFDFDVESGTFSNRQVFVDTRGDQGKPDGLTVDSEGYVWSARWNGGSIVRHHPDDGRVVDRVAIPARKVSCLTFGGTDYDQAFVTTATAGNDRSVEGDGAGALFRFEADTSGVPEYRSQISLPD